MSRGKAMVLLLVMSGAVLFWHNRNDIDAYTGPTSSAGSPQEVLLPPTSDSYTVIGEVTGIKNFVVKYDNDFYRGGEPVSEEGMEYLKNQGIKTIITITPNQLEEELSAQYGINLVSLEFTKKTLNKDVLDQYFDILNKYDKPWYVHCHGGTHRGGVLGAAYRLKVLRWDWNRSIIEYGMLGGSLKDDYCMLEILKNHK